MRIAQLNDLDTNHHHHRTHSANKKRGIRRRICSEDVRTRFTEGVRFGGVLCGPSVSSLSQSQSVSEYRALNSFNIFHRIIEMSPQLLTGNCARAGLSKWKCKTYVYIGNKPFGTLCSVQSVISHQTNALTQRSSSIDRSRSPFIIVDRPTDRSG